jgi:cytochrome c-type biogenesis protein CcmH
MKSVLAVCLLLCAFSLWAAAPVPQDEKLEARYRALTSELRCLVCQNESIADSHADLAKDLRNQVRAMLEQGKTDQEIMNYLTARYGDFVRFRPPLKPATVALWFGPFVLMALGGGLLVAYMARRRMRVSNAPLSAGEREKLAALLHGAGDEGKG